MSQEIPPAMPLQYATPLRGNPRLLTIGLAQRRLVWAILCALLVALSIGMSQVMAPASPALRSIMILVIDLFRLGFEIFMIVCVGQMAAALGYGRITCILYVVGMLIPLINLLVLLKINQKATHQLELNGIKVHLMGAKLADLLQQT